MIGKPFRTPLLKKTEESGDNDGVSEPQAKKRRISSDRVDSVKTMGPQLVFKTPGISSLPRKPLLAVENPELSQRRPDGGLEGFYNVLWYVHQHDECTNN